MAIDMSSKATFVKFGCIGLNFVAFLIILVGTFIPYWHIEYVTGASLYLGINGNCAYSVNNGITVTGTLQEELLEQQQLHIQLQQQYRPERSVKGIQDTGCRIPQANYEIALAGILTIGALVCLLNCLLAAGSMFLADKVLSHCLFLTSFLSALLIFAGLSFFLLKSDVSKPSQKGEGGRYYGASFYLVCFAFLLNAFGIIAASFASIFRTDQQAAGPTGFVQAFAPAATAPPTAPN